MTDKRLKARSLTHANLQIIRFRCRHFSLAQTIHIDAPKQTNLLHFSLIGAKKAKIDHTSRVERWGKDVPCRQLLSYNLVQYGNSVRPLPFFLPLADLIRHGFCKAPKMNLPDGL